MATAEKIKEIAEQLECGNRAFMHKTTKELLFIPDTNNYVDIALEAWSEELKLLEKNIIDYYEIEKWTSSESFDLMADFTENLTKNPHLQNQLIASLNKKKPFREFKFVIDNSGPFRQQWFDFKNLKLQEFVARQLKQFDAMTDEMSGNT